MLKDHRITVIAGGNDSGKSFSTDILNKKLGNNWKLSAEFRSGLTVYQNFSLLVYGTKNEDFINHLSQIRDDVFMENTKMFHSDHLSFGFYLKAVLALIYDFDFNVLLAETKFYKEKRNTLGLRQYLYNFGEHAKKFDQKIWAKALFSILENTSRRAMEPKSKDIIINDLRFIPEVEYMLGLETRFRVLHLTRFGAGTINADLINIVSNSPEIDYYYLENNGSVSDLELKLSEIFS